MSFFVPPSLVISASSKAQYNLQPSPTWLPFYSRSRLYIFVPLVPLLFPLPPGTMTSCITVAKISVSFHVYVASPTRIYLNPCSSWTWQNYRLFTCTVIFCFDAYVGSFEFMFQIDFCYVLYSALSWCWLYFNTILSNVFTSFLCDSHYVLIVHVPTACYHGHGNECSVGLYH